MWKLQIAPENENNYCNYLIQEPDKVYDSNNKLLGYTLYGKYYGSSTRIGDLGTIYYGSLKKYITLKIRLLDENDKILFDKTLTKDDIENLIDSSSSFRINNAKIHVRDLHRWQGYPFEISGITIYI